MDDINTQTARSNALQTASINQARELVLLLETGRTKEANRILNELCRLRETDLYQEIGKLTRELHEAVQTFDIDDDLRMLMKSNMTDAKQHLDYVMQTTESSTHRTLGAIENCTPVIDGLTHHAAALQRRLRELMHEAAMDQAVYGLVSATDVFLSRIEADAVSIRASMMDVLMAQEYQDVTGQVIQRVIGIVQQLETHMVNMLRAAARYADTNVSQARERTKPVAGTGAKQHDEALKQDDVDDLLDSLGF